jgi:hypothetical protein
MLNSQERCWISFISCLNRYWCTIWYLEPERNLDFLHLSLQLRHSKISDFGLDIFIQQDIFILHITVNNPFKTFVVEISKPSCQLWRNLIPLFSSQTKIGTKQHLVQWTILNIHIYQKPVWLLEGAAGRGQRECQVERGRPRREARERKKESDWEGYFRYYNKYWIYNNKIIHLNNGSDKIKNLWSLEWHFSKSKF